MFRLGNCMCKDPMAGGLLATENYQAFVIGEQEVGGSLERGQEPD